MGKIGVCLWFKDQAEETAKYYTSIFNDSRFSEATSFIVTCEDQAEIDYFWGKLSAVPQAEQCGWLVDKFGLSWQVVPQNLDQLIGNSEGMKAMLGMTKLDIHKLKEAAGQ